MLLNNIMNAQTCYALFFRLSVNENEQIVRRKKFKLIYEYRIYKSIQYELNVHYLLTHGNRTKLAAYAKVEIRRQATILKQFAREHSSFHIWMVAIKFKASANIFQKRKYHHHHSIDWCSALWHEHMSMRCFVWWELMCRAAINCNGNYGFFVCEYKNKLHKRIACLVFNWMQSMNENIYGHSENSNESMQLWNGWCLIK